MHRKLKIYGNELVAHFPLIVCSLPGLRFSLTCCACCICCWEFFANFHLYWKRNWFLIFRLPEWSNLDFICFLVACCILVPVTWKADKPIYKSGKVKYLQFLVAEIHVDALQAVEVKVVSAIIQFSSAGISTQLCTINGRAIKAITVQFKEFFKLVWDILCIRNSNYYFSYNSLSFILWYKLQEVKRAPESDLKHSESLVIRFKMSAAASINDRTSCEKTLSI